jgi:hypothetical protein
VTPSFDPLPNDLAAAHAMIVAQREMLRLAQSELTVSRLEIERYKLMSRRGASNTANHLCSASDRAARACHRGPRGNASGGMKHCSPLGRSVVAA